MPSANHPTILFAHHFPYHPSRWHSLRFFPPERSRPSSKSKPSHRYVPSTGTYKIPGPFSDWGGLVQGQSPYWFIPALLPATISSGRIHPPFPSAPPPGVTLFLTEHRHPLLEHHSSQWVSFQGSAPFPFFRLPFHPTTPLLRDAGPFFFSIPPLASFPPQPSFSKSPPKTDTEIVSYLFRIDFVERGDFHSRFLLESRLFFKGSTGLHSDTHLVKYDRFSRPVVFFLGLHLPFWTSPSTCI